MVFEASELTRTLTRVRGLRDQELDYQLLRILGLAEYGGSSVGETLAAASTVASGDPASWVRSFGALAASVEQTAAGCMAGGHLVSARDQLLRASTYYRAAGAYSEFDPVLRDEHLKAGRSCFSRAGALFDPPIRALAAPFEGALLPGYVVDPQPGTIRAGRTPDTLVAIGGFDGAAEDLYFTLGAPGAARGWRVVVFDGPGQGGAIGADQRLVYRPDYEVVFGAVIEELARMGLYEPGRLALAGLSMGSYMAACAAARGCPVDALVLDPPVVDLYAYMRAFLGSELFSTPENLRPDDVTGMPSDLLPPQVAWGIRAVCRRFGVGSFHEWRDVLETFRLGEQVAAIACPVLGLVGSIEGEEVSSQARLVSERLGTHFTLRRFGEDEGAEAHCQAGNRRLAAQVIYDWLDERFSGPLDTVA